MRNRKKPYRERTLAKYRTRSSRKLAGAKRTIKISPFHSDRQVNTAAHYVSDYYMSYPPNHEARYVDIHAESHPVEDSHPMGRFGKRRLLEAKERVARLVTKGA